MEKCYACGAELPSQSRFCSRCGAAQEDMTHPDELTQINNPQVERLPPTLDPEATFIEDTQTPLPQAMRPSDEKTELVSRPSEQREERRGAAMLDVAAPALLVGDPTIPAPHLPGIRGTPQAGSFPSLPGTPQPIPASPAGGYPHPAYAPPGPAPQHGWQQSAGQVGQHTAGHAIRAGAGKTAGGFALKWIILLITAVVVLGGGAAGALAYVLTRPQPVISISSPYKVGNTPAGSAGTSLHLTGQHFSGSSSIIFLLDGTSAPGAPHVASDSQGNLNVNLPVTTAWSKGRHTLTASDAGGYSTKSGVVVEIVAQGEAHTPGPLGAPPDDASFRVNIQFQGQYDQGGGPFHGSDTEIVTGRPDPAGGRVCQLEDDGQPHTYTSHTLNTGLPETQTVVYSCSGTYKAGTLTLTETLVSDTIQLTDQGSKITCHLLTPGVDERLTGSYTAQGTFSGTLTLVDFPRTDFSCTTGPFSSFYFFLYGGTGTWTGTLSNS